jgi:ABC-type transporter Mla MlaB component
MHSVLTLPSELTIYTVGELRPAWLAAVAEAPGDAAAGEEVCRVEGAAVDSVDAAGIQLLVALVNYLAARHRTLQLVDPSRPLAQACETLGLSGLLALQQLPGGGS